MKEDIGSNKVKMTKEKLKAEAEKQGYVLTKKIKYEKLEPCLCGNKRICSSLEVIDGKWVKTYYCSKCHNKGKPAKYLYQAKHNWNEAIIEATSIDGWIND